MSLGDAFQLQTSAPAYQKPVVAQRAKRLAPFSLRLNEEERARLVAEAAGAPLGSYVKAKLFGETPPVRMRRSSLVVEDRASLAQALALLGRSRLSSNLNQLAHAAHIGALGVTPDVEDELRAALGDVRAIRALLLFALGLKPEAAT